MGRVNLFFAALTMLAGGAARRVSRPAAGLALPPPGVPRATWALTVLGCARYYLPSTGLLMPGFLAGRNRLHPCRFAPLAAPRQLDASRTPAVNASCQCLPTPAVPPADDPEARALGAQLLRLAAVGSFGGAAPSDGCPLPAGVPPPSPLASLAGALARPPLGAADVA
eukprot:1190447-Prorocentrum_minimum.AAC.1